MNLIIIYGPPASGKLEIAKALSKATDYKLFHNHLSSNLARELFDFNTWEFVNYCAELRITTFKYFGSIDQNLIFTTCYIKGALDDFLDKVLKLENVNPIFVRLVADRETLLQRVGNEERKKFGKLNDPDHLDRVLNMRDYFLPISGVDSLEIPTATTTVEDSVKKILEYMA